MKTIWVVEKQDNHGEFQPMPLTVCTHKFEIVKIIDSLKASKHSKETDRFRPMQYVRKENKA